MTSTRRPLKIDDPLGAAEACHVARPTAASTAGRLRDLPLNQIRPNPNQPSRRFDETSLLTLADSIRERGVLQPVIVQPREPDGYELIAGERRWRAARLADLETIPALVDDVVDDGVSLELALIENIARADLTVIEEAHAIASLLDDLNVSRAALARRLGRSRSDLAHTIRLLELPDQAIGLIDSGRLTKGHGKALLTEPDHDRRRQLALRAADGDWSVRKLEAEVTPGGAPGRSRAVPPPDQLAAATTLEETVSKALGVGVQARPHRAGYQLLLDQAAGDRLVRLLDVELRADEPGHVARPSSRGSRPTTRRCRPTLLPVTPQAVAPITMSPLEPSSPPAVVDAPARVGGRDRRPNCVNQRGDPGIDEALM